jgi:hypothetical protein
MEGLFGIEEDSPDQKQEGLVYEVTNSPDLGRSASCKVLKESKSHLSIRYSDAEEFTSSQSSSSYSCSS